MRLAGMMFPGKATPVNGSLITTIAVPLYAVGTPFAPDRVKFPARSRSVGTVRFCTPFGLSSPIFSDDTKKNIFPLLLATCGICSGPPKLPPAYEMRSGVWAMPAVPVKTQPAPAGV